jgi:SAM-dependent methyltransferase
LELGCGTGAYAVWLAQHGFEVAAIDLSTRPIDRARQRPDTFGVNVRSLGADARDRPDDLSGPFDFFFDRGCCHAVRREDVSAFLATLRRLTRPGTLGIAHDVSPPGLAFSARTRCIAKPDTQLLLALPVFPISRAVAVPGAVPGNPRVSANRHYLRVPEYARDTRKGWQPAAIPVRSCVKRLS